MKTEGFGVWGSKLRSLFDRYKFVLVVILAGVVLLLLPSFGGEKRGGGAVESSQESGSDPFQVEELERKLEQALAQIDGVGEVRVVLPSFLIILLVARFYAAFRSSAIVSGAMGGLRPAVIGMIGAAVVSVGQTVFLPEGLAAVTAYPLVCSLTIFVLMAVLTYK